MWGLFKKKSCKQAASYEFIGSEGKVTFEFCFTPEEPRKNKYAQKLLEQSIELRVFNIETAISGMNTALNIDTITNWWNMIVEEYNEIVAAKDYGFPVKIDTNITEEQLNHDFNKALLKSIEQDFEIYQRGV